MYRSVMIDIFSFAKILHYFPTPKYPSISIRGRNYFGIENTTGKSLIVFALLVAFVAAVVDGVCPYPPVVRQRHTSYTQTPRQLMGGFQ